MGRLVETGLTAAGRGSNSIDSTGLGPLTMVVARVIFGMERPERAVGALWMAVPGRFAAQNALARWGMRARTASLLNTCCCGRI